MAFLDETTLKDYASKWDKIKGRNSEHRGLKRYRQIQEWVTNIRNAKVAISGEICTIDRNGDKKRPSFRLNCEAYGPAKDDMPDSGAAKCWDALRDGIEVACNKEEVEPKEWVDLIAEVWALLMGAEAKETPPIRRVSDFRVFSNQITKPEKSSPNLTVTKQGNPDSQFVSNNYFFQIMRFVQDVNESELKEGQKHPPLEHLLGFDIKKKQYDSGKGIPLVLRWPDHLKEESPENQNERNGVYYTALKTRFVLKFLWMWANRDTVIAPVSFQAFLNLCDSELFETAVKSCGDEPPNLDKLKDNQKQLQYRRIVALDYDDFLPIWRAISGKITQSSGLEKTQERVGTVSEILSVLTLDEPDSRNIEELLEIGSKAVILYGPPGTGKTYEAKKVAEQLTGDKEKGEKWDLIQFHPSYSYEDFIGGIRPVLEGNNITYRWEPGDFTRFCRKADADAKGKYVFIIDEINRANLSAVLGPVLYCLEYRGRENQIQLYDSHGSHGPEFDSLKRLLLQTEYRDLRLLYRNYRLEDPKKQPLPCSYNLGLADQAKLEESFCIPNNVYVIGTMNNVDKSLVTFDIALRRRFAFFELAPNMNVLEQIMSGSEAEGNDDSGPCFPDEVVVAYVQRCRQLNDGIKDLGLADEYKIGHAYFLKIRDICIGPAVALGSGIRDSELTITTVDLERLWNYHLQPLLEEYLGQRAKGQSDNLAKLKKEFCQRLAQGEQA
jgi:hypothetical protein